MAQVKLVMMGCPITTNRAMFGIPTIVLIQGRFTTLYDVGAYSTRHQLLDGLKEHGVTPGKIDKVILSHLHWDHALYMDPFRGVEVILTSDEYAQASDENRRDTGTPPFMVDMLRSHKLCFVRGDEQIEDGVQLIKVPGHTAGMLAVKVTDGTEMHVIAGDAVAHARYLKTGHERGWFDQKLAEENMYMLAGMGGIIYPAHDRPFRYDVATKTATYLQPYKMTLTCRFQASGDAVTIDLASC